MSSGVYQIRNKVSGLVYVGSSTNIERRWVRHRKMLNGGVHDNKHLNSAWTKYGADSFEFTILELVPQDKVYEVEQRYLDIAKVNPDQYYNTQYDVRANPRVIRLIGQSLKGRKLTAEHRRKIGESLRGRFYSEITRKKIGAFSSQRVHTEETKRKIGAANKGKLKPESTRRKISLGNKGKHPKLGYFDPTVYIFVNDSLSVCFEGLRVDFVKADPEVSSSAVFRLVHGVTPCVKGWRLVRSTWAIEGL
jgi:group I intron endonuclease